MFRKHKEHGGGVGCEAKHVQNTQLCPPYPHISQSITERAFPGLGDYFFLHLPMDGHLQDKLKSIKIASIPIPTQVCVCLESRINSSLKAFCCLAWDYFGCLQNFTSTKYEFPIHVSSLIAQKLKKRHVGARTQDIGRKRITGENKPYLTLIVYFPLASKDPAESPLSYSL